MALYLLWGEGKGPRRMQVGSRVTISREADDEWRREREADDGWRREREPEAQAAQQQLEA